MERLYTKKEICELLNISLSKVNRDMKKGLPFNKVGHSVRFDLNQVKEFYNIK